MRKNNKIILLGAGGHAKVVLSTLIESNYEILGLFDDNPLLLGSNLLGHRVIGQCADLKKFTGAHAICALGDNKLRHTLTALYDLHWLTLIHPRAYVHPSVTLGCGTVVLAGAIIQPEAKVAEHAIINTAASIDHDCQIDGFAHIAPGTHLGGGVKVGEGVLIGIGSSIKPYTAIGKWSVLGAGSVVVSNIPRFVYAKGVPAKAYKNC